MISNLSQLAVTLLAAGALFASPPLARAGGGAETAQDQESRVVELKLMARRLMERVEDHRARLERLDNLIRYHKVRGHADEVRKLEALRQREVESFESTLSEIHRLLGSQDFERVSKAIRYLTHNAVPDEGTATSADLARSSPEEASAAATAQAGSARVQASIERSLDRQIMLERARASQKLQLAQRLQAARDQQLRLIAQQQRRFQPPAATTGSTRERGANAGATPPAGGRRQAAPYQRP